MLETLFKATRTLKDGVTAASNSSSSAIALAVGLIGDGDRDGTESAMLSLPGAAGAQGANGANGPPGMDGENLDEQYPVFPSYDVGRVTAGFILPADPSSAQNGIIWRGNTLAANRFLHTFADPVNASSGRNLFLGLGAGNFTLGTGGGSTDLASYNTGIGYGALAALTTGHSNVAIGESAASLMTTGLQNIAIGRLALQNATTPSNLVAIGFQSLRNVTTGSSLTVIGQSSGAGITTGSDCTVVGKNCLSVSTTCQYNTVIGTDSMQASGNANNNVAIGRRALLQLGTGTGQNVSVGSRSGETCTTDDNCTFVGYFADRSGGSAIVNSIAIGSLAKVGASNTCVIGTSALVATLLNGSVGIQVASPTAILHLKAGTATANTAPLKFSSGTLLTTAEAGAVEFLTDAYYGTITTGAARKTFAFLESPVFVTPNIDTANGISLSLSNTINLIATGGAPTVGQATLVGGTVTVNTTAMTATALLFLQIKTAGGTVLYPLTYTQVNNTSFTVNSASVLDTSVVNWWIVETH